MRRLCTGLPKTRLCLPGSLPSFSVTETPVHNLVKLDKYRPFVAILHPKETPRIGNPRLEKARRRSDVQIITFRCIALFLRPLDAGHFLASDFQSVAFQSVASASIRGSQSAALNFQSVNGLLVPALVKPFIAEIIGMVPGWPHLGNKAVVARNFVDVLVPAGANFPVVATMHTSKAKVCWVW